jgi:hypothetical protein
MSGDSFRDYQQALRAAVSDTTMTAQRTTIPVVVPVMG